MTILIVLCVSVVLGLGAVFWLLKNDKEDFESTVQQMAPDSISLDNTFDSTVTDTLSDTEPLPLGEEIKLDKTGKEKKNLFAKLNLKKFIPRKKERSSPDLSEPKPAKQKSSKSIVGNLMSKLKSFKKNKKEADPLSLNLSETPSLQDVMKAKEDQFGIQSVEKPTPTYEAPVQETGTASITTLKTPEPSEEKTLTKDEEEKIEKEVDSSFELKELQQKYENLDNLFKEKGELLLKAEESLKNELGNQKDFNKVKDILEKELKDVKETHKGAQVEMNNSKTEVDNLQNRINQLEENSTALEKGILSKEDEIEKLNKELSELRSQKNKTEPETPASEKEKQTSESSAVVEPDKKQVEDQPIEKEKPVAEPGQSAGSKEPQLKPGDDMKSASGPEEAKQDISNSEPLIKPEPHATESPGSSDQEKEKKEEAPLINPENTPGISTKPIGDIKLAPENPITLTEDVVEENTSGDEEKVPLIEPENAPDISTKPIGDIKLVPENPFTLTEDVTEDEDEEENKEDSFLSLNPDIITQDEPGKSADNEETSQTEQEENPEQPDEKEKEKE